MNQRVENIQSSGHTACIVVTGGGSGAVHELLTHPGASRFVGEVRIPYSREALAAFLGEQPESFCSEETARKMADKASKMGSLGIACTAALATSYERNDSDRAFFGFQTLEKQEFHTLEFSGGSRIEQEALLSEAILQKLADFLGQE